MPQRSHNHPNHPNGSQSDLTAPYFFTAISKFAECTANQAIAVGMSFVQFSVKSHAARPGDVCEWLPMRQAFARFRGGRQGNDSKGSETGPHFCNE
ncbi:hypothetical protein CFAM422_006861 [Trichoderma lentiforme]|uniref:Uncharacterized protein n=1 Tax=Trichoderma lentiforme TaxID=1567552 RepID=A0A9P4XG04_9HYPO|nr:hypothetical protein CFAM422_006861 [Trichoderma lentiforme]